MSKFNRKIPPEEVLDLKKWAAYFAIIDLTGTHHGSLIKSVKFYYNPINGLFEPITLTFFKCVAKEIFEPFVLF